MTFGNDIYTASVRDENVINGRTFRLRKKKSILFQSFHFYTSYLSFTRISQTTCTGCIARTATRNILAGLHNEVLSLKYTYHNNICIRFKIEKKKYRIRV